MVFQPTFTPRQPGPQSETPGPKQRAAPFPTIPTGDPHVTLSLASNTDRVFIGNAVAAGCRPGNRRRRGRGFHADLNGKDLTGWDGKLPNWYVEDGAITGENSAQRPCRGCNYLFWRGGKPADFELRCLYRISSQGNSGVQFRSRELPDSTLPATKPTLTAAQNIQAPVRLQQPHTTRRGQKVVIDENGKREVASFGDRVGVGEARQSQRLERLPHYRPRPRNHFDYQWYCHVANDRLREGEGNLRRAIALQLHDGDLMKVQFRNLRIRTSNIESAAKLYTAGLSSSIKSAENTPHCWTSQQWHPHFLRGPNNFFQNRTFPTL